MTLLLQTKISFPEILVKKIILFNTQRRKTTNKWDKDDDVNSFNDPKLTLGIVH